MQDHLTVTGALAHLDLSLSGEISWVGFEDGGIATIFVEAVCDFDVRIANIRGEAENGRKSLPVCCLCRSSSGSNRLPQSRCEVWIQKARAPGSRNVPKA